MFMNTALKAIVARGSANQAVAAECVLNEMDKPAIWTDSPSATQHTHSLEFRTRITEDNILRVFYLPNTKTVTDFQLLSLIVRVTTNARWMFTYNAARAVATRGKRGGASRRGVVVQRTRPACECFPG